MLMKDVVVSILAKDKGYCLDFYLKCIYNQTFDKKRIHLYIRTNDNNDNTQEILEKFISDHGSEYASVYYNSESVDETLKQWGNHEWSMTRLHALSKIREESLEYAKQKDAHYFVADCDNFIVPETLEAMYGWRKVGVVAPLLRLSKDAYYANIHLEVDDYGYNSVTRATPEYESIVFSYEAGLHPVAVVHCTYFIDNDLLNEVTYIDGSERHDYIILSDTLRKKNIPQYVDNTQFWGFLALINNDHKYIGVDCWDEFISECWSEEYNNMVNYES